MKAKQNKELFHYFPLEVPCPSFLPAVMAERDIMWYGVSLW